MRNRRDGAAWLRRGLPLAAMLVVLAAAGCGAGEATEANVDASAAASGGADVDTGSAQGSAAEGAASGSDAQDALAALSPEAQEALSPGADMLAPVVHIKEAHDAGVDLVFVDARPPLDYEFGHIPGALSVPYYEAADYVDEIPRDKLVVVYCECPHAEAVQTADALVAAGFPNVKVIDEGLFGWTELGGELVAGTPARP